MRMAYMVGWSENHCFEVDGSEAALRYQNPIYEILARSVRRTDPYKRSFGNATGAKK